MQTKNKIPMDQVLLLDRIGSTLAVLKKIVNFNTKRIRTWINK